MKSTKKQKSQINIRLNDNFKFILKFLCDERKQSDSNFIRQAIFEMYLDILQSED